MYTNYTTCASIQIKNSCAIKKFANVKNRGESRTVLMRTVGLMQSTLALEHPQQLAQPRQFR